AITCFRNSVFRCEHVVVSSFRTTTRPNNKKRPRTHLYGVSSTDKDDAVVRGNIRSVPGEDEVLWPKLRIRIPRCDEEIQRAEDEHAGISELIDKVQSLRPSWRASAESRLAEQLSGAVDELWTGIKEHFEHEEQNIVPLIGEYITPDEWQAFIDRGATYVNPRNLWFALAYAGLLLRDATPDEQRRFIAAVPLGLRIVLKLLGGRAYDAYQTKLYGIPA
ncbi:MAG: hypothetical protein QOI25_3570, partial [Mycobacterium sp.]|nr:hypothetical protein [Mycobacterium sp.]